MVRRAVLVTSPLLLVLVIATVTRAQQPDAAPVPPSLKQYCEAPDGPSLSFKADIRLANDGQPTPPDCSGELFDPAHARNAWSVTEFRWVAPRVRHQPLYWDDVPLERYGQARHEWIQPWISAARFFGTFPVIPYKMGIDPPFERVTTLGKHRPGGPTPCLRQRLPWELDAALLEAGAWVGMVFLLP